MQRKESNGKTGERKQRLWNENASLKKRKKFSKMKNNGEQLSADYSKWCCYQRTCAPHATLCLKY